MKYQIVGTLLNGTAVLLFLWFASGSQVQYNDYDEYDI